MIFVKIRIETDEKESWMLLEFQDLAWTIFDAPKAQDEIEQAYGRDYHYPNKQGLYGAELRGTLADGSYRIIVFGTEVYLTNEAGKTIDYINGYGS